jgi:predicted Zn finger-like uncharacterized protein
MLINCKSCQKKFNVPDSAITDKGRLLECGSCGNKWTQFPVKEKPIKEQIRTAPAVVNQTIKVNKPKTLAKKKKREIKLYSEEYLKKKHGLEIKSLSKDRKVSSSSKFFPYLIITIIYLTALFGVINITRDFIIASYPFTEIYINSLYEMIEILELTISNLVS